MFEFNPLSPEFQSNPYAYYHGLRDAMPIYHWEHWQMWFLSRYNDCVAVLKDSRFGRELDDPSFRMQIPDSQRVLVEMQRDWMLLRDPPSHTRLKMLAHKAFTPRTVERMRSNIEALTDNLLDAIQDTHKLDLIADLASPLPVTVIADLIGVPHEDRPTFQRWSQALAFTLELVDDPQIYDAASVVTEEFSAYLRDLIAERRKHPQEDFLTALIAAKEHDDVLTESEMIATIILLLVAGHETTVNLIGNGTQALLHHPDQWEKLKADPSLVRNAVEEMLRYDSPVQLTARIAHEDVTVDGQAIPKGGQVALLLGAANRDPQQFPDPDKFDITRTGADKHIGFGNGIHFCLGAPLARVEAEIAFKSILRKLPNLALTDQAPTYRSTYVLRGLASLPLTF
jgi:pimeloyl-[acyl-carrier protein] synthase